MDKAQDTRHDERSGPEAGARPAPRFEYGQVVRHRLLGYRGVIVDVHPEFRGSEEWFRHNVADDGPAGPRRDRPWYQVLVHGQPIETYVPERSLEPDLTGLPVAHPYVRVFFNQFKGGRYSIGGPPN